MNPFSAMSRSAMRERPKWRRNPRERPVIEQRLRMRIGDEFRGSARSFAYAAARCFGGRLRVLHDLHELLRFVQCFVDQLLAPLVADYLLDVFAMISLGDQAADLPAAVLRSVLSSPRNGMPSSRSSASAWSSRLAVVTNVMSIPWICSTMS